MDILNQFGINPILLAAQVVNFFILLWILKRFLYGPILKVLTERRKRIEDSLKNAEEIEKKLQQTQQHSEKIIADTLKEAQKIMDQTKEAAAQLLADTNKQAEQILLKAEEDGKKIIQIQEQVLMDQMKENAGRLVALVFEKVTGKRITKEDHKNIIEREIENLS